MNRITLTALALSALAGTAAAQTERSIKAQQIAEAARNAGLLELVATNGQQQIEITVGPLPGEVTVAGIEGLPLRNVYTGITSIRLLTGNRHDFVEFRLLSDVVPEIWVNTGAGTSDVKFTYEIPASPEAVTSKVTVIGGTSGDLVAFNVNSGAASFTSDWKVDQGNGNNETVVAFNSPELSDNLSLTLNQNTGTGSDKLEFNVISAAAATSFNIGGNLGPNVDTANIIATSLVPTSGAALINLTMGAGNDAFNAELIAPASTMNVAGTVTGNDGFDALVFKQEADGNVDLAFDAGSGIDLTDMFFKGFITGAPVQRGGAGNDELKLVVDGPLLAAPFIDGGTGFDKAIGFGTIINCEEVN